MLFDPTIFKIYDFHLSLLDLNFYQEKFNWQKILFLRNIWFSWNLEVLQLTFKILRFWNLEDFDLKFGTWNLKFWDLEFWKLKFEIFIIKPEVWIFLKTEDLSLNLGIENVELKIWRRYLKTLKKLFLFLFGLTKF